MPTRLEAVQWLTISEVAALWAPQLKMPASTIERELRYGFYKIDKNNTGELTGSYEDLKKPLEKSPPDEELPSSEAMVSRKFIESFCDKQLWMLPDFWFQDLPTGPSFPGRPSLMQSIAEELKRAAAANGVEPTLAGQSRKLETWVHETYPGKQIPTARSIENGIRISYNALKNDYPPKPH